MRAARLEAESEPPLWARHESKTCNFPRSPPIERMRALLDRLNTAQYAVTGPSPTRVSFSRIAEWCERTAGVPAPQIYRDLLQSYLSGAFEHTLVFYLTNSAPDLSDDSGLVGYRMRRTFLAARTRTLSPDDAKEAGVLFEAYLAPCWVHRAAAVRWLESKGYPLPSQWMAPSGSADGSSEKEPIATRRTKKPSKLESWAREQIAAENIPGKTKGFSWKEAERRANCLSHVNGHLGTFPEAALQQTAGPACQLGHSCHLGHGTHAPSRSDFKLNKCALRFTRTRAQHMSRDKERLEPLAVSPKQATQLVPIGITKLYEALNSGVLESQVVNGRRWSRLPVTQTICRRRAYAVTRDNAADQALPCPAVSLAERQSLCQKPAE